MKETTIRKILAVTIGICIAAFLVWNILYREPQSLLFRSHQNQTIK